MQPPKKVNTNDNAMILDEQPPVETEQPRPNSVEKKSYLLFKRTASQSTSSSEKEPEIKTPTKVMPTIELKEPSNKVEKMVVEVKEPKTRLRSLSIGSFYSSPKVSKKQPQQVKTEKLPTCESIINSNFTLITEETIRKMIPKERVSLQKALENTKKRAKNSDRVELFTRTARGLELIAAIQEELRNEQLINLIEKNENDHWSALFIAGETIIPPAKLFSLIRSKIEILNKEHSPRLQLVPFQLFCTHWLERNKGSLLIKQAEPEIKAIIDLTSQSLEQSVSKQSRTLHTTLQTALIERPLTTKLVKYLSDNYINFS
ncbi:MAG: hypothetical protein JSR46_02005, partial [Verrucomicrobia bacterium]|nr:hypothetical protein [Verrucomicrobiota bacterium]